MTQILIRSSGSVLTVEWRNTMIIAFRDFGDSKMYLREAGVCAGGNAGSGRGYWLPDELFDVDDLPPPYEMLDQSFDDLAPSEGAWRTLGADLCPGRMDRERLFPALARPTLH